MSKDKGTSAKQSRRTKEFLENVSCTRRSKIKGISIDKKKLTMLETEDLMVTYFERENERYLELIKMEREKDV